MRKSIPTFSAKNSTDLLMRHVDRIAAVGLTVIKRGWKFSEYQ